MLKSSVCPDGNFWTAQPFCNRTCASPVEQPNYVVTWLACLPLNSQTMRRGWRKLWRRSRPSRSPAEVATESTSWKNSTMRSTAPSSITTPSLISRRWGRAVNYRCWKHLLCPVNCWCWKSWLWNNWYIQHTVDTSCQTDAVSGKLLVLKKLAVKQLIYSAHCRHELSNRCCIWQTVGAENASCQTAAVSFWDKVVLVVSSFCCLWLFDNTLPSCHCKCLCNYHFYL